MLGNVQLVMLMVQSSRLFRTSAARYLRSGHVDGALFVSMQPPGSDGPLELWASRWSSAGRAAGRARAQSVLCGPSTTVAVPNWPCGISWRAAGP